MNTKVAKKNNKGFTLIELIVVIAIIAVLAAILAPQYLRYVEKSRVTSDEATAREIKNAVQTACADSDVFEAVNSNDTVEWDKDGTLTAAGAAVNSSTAKTAKLAYELAQTIKEVPHMKSKKWRGGTGKYTIKITVENDSVKLDETFPYTKTTP